MLFVKFSFDAGNPTLIALATRDSNVLLTVIRQSDTAQVNPRGSKGSIIFDAFQASYGMWEDVFEGSHKCWRGLIANSYMIPPQKHTDSIQLLKLCIFEEQ